MNSRTCRPLSVFFTLILISTSLGAQATKPQYVDLETIGKRDINKDSVNFSSMESEMQLGRQAAAELERSITLADDNDVSAYVDRIAQNIAKNSDAKFPITIRVIQSDTMNATALPGGFIYINSATIKAVDSEAELAFVIAHLVGHVAARHATEHSSRGTLMQIAQTTTMTLAGGRLGASIRELPQPGVETQTFAFSRGAVNEADYLGLIYLYKAGYDSEAAVRFLRKLEETEASLPKLSSQFKTHPATADRIKQMQNHIRLVLPPRERNINNTQEFDSIKLRVN